MVKERYYQVVRELILKRLKSGDLRPGDKLPSERQLSEELTLNRNTVRHALLHLQREGRIFRLERRGWFVNPIRLVYNPANHVNFARLAESQDRVAHWTTEDNGIVIVSDKIDAGGEEGFSDGTPVYEMENIFSLDGQKVAYTLNYLHAEHLAGIIPKTAERAMTQVVQDEYGFSLAQRDLLIRPQLLTRDIAHSLDLSHGSPGIYIRRIKTDDAGNVLTVEHEFWRYDAIELRVNR